jgi:hypothetical protein
VNPAFRIAEDRSAANDSRAPAFAIMRSEEVQELRLEFELRQETVLPIRMKVVFASSP